MPWHGVVTTTEVVAHLTVPTEEEAEKIATDILLLKKQLWAQDTGLFPAHIPGLWYALPLHVIRWIFVSDASEPHDSNWLQCKLT